MPSPAHEHIRSSERTESPSSPWGTRETREREREAKREAVLSTAVRLFNLKGFYATSLDDVAAALNVTKPTIYHYFPSKDDILFACLQLGLKALREAADAAALQRASGLSRLRALMRDYALIMTRDFGICVARTTDNQLSSENREKFRAARREIDAILRGVIVAGMSDGSIAPCDARIASFTISGALDSIAHWYEPDGPDTAEAVAEAMIAVLVQGLEPRGSV